MTLFQARPYGRFTEIQNDLRIKKLHRLNQGSDFLGHSFSEKKYISELQSNLEETVSPSINDDFSSVDSTIFTSIAPELSDQLDETN